LLAERTGISVVADFRSRDIAAGGQGAPLVPAFHAKAFGHPDIHRVIANIGGIANITDLPTNGVVRGWDTGPGNMLLDAWIQRHRGQHYDRDGAWAASGCVHTGLLETLAQHAFLPCPPPKSAGREQFNLTWLDAALGDLGHAIAPVDVQATLLEFTALSLANAIQNECGHAREVYVCGGGAHNSQLMQRIAARLAQATVSTTATLGIDPDWVEAIAFAWLARQTLHHEPGNLPGVTGAKGKRVLGAIYPA
jgi:anhydro-N-acetylmuramic acid kinase